MSGVKQGYLYSIMSVFIMSVTPILNKIVVGAYNPLVSVFYFSLLSTFFTGISVIKDDINYPSKNVLSISIVNTLGVIAQFFSLSILSAATFAFIGRFYIVFTVVLAALMLKEKLHKNDVIAIIISIIGSVLVSNANPDFNNLVGIAFALIYTFLFALASNLTKNVLKNTSVNNVNFYNQLTATVITGLMLLLSGQSFKISYLDLLIICFSALASGVIGLAYYYKGMKLLDISKVGIIRSLSPVIILIYSVLVFHTMINTQLIVGGILIILSILVMNMNVGSFKKRRIK